MIVRPTSGSLRIVTQPDHARFAAELLSLWRADGLPAHPRRDDLLFAVREHDNGWREADAAPRVDPATRRPVDFLGLPEPQRIEVWRLGIHRWARERPAAARLIVEHADRLHRADCTGDAWAAFFEELDSLRDELESSLRAAGVVPTVEDYPWLRLADGLSLAACAGLDGEVRSDGVGHRGGLAGDDLWIDPFPLAGATTFRIPCRTIPDRRYEGDADLGGTLAAARWSELAVRVTPRIERPSVAGRE